MTRRKILYILIYLLATVLAVFWQEIGTGNTDITPASNYGMWITADAPSYTAPPINWIETGHWKDNTIGPSSYCQRPPGYGIIIGICYLISHEHYLGILKIIQILAFLGSLILVSQILKELKIEGRINMFATVFYALLPCYSSTMYLVLTEGITPFFLLMVIYYWYRMINHESNAILFIVFSSFLLMIRPQLLLIVVLMAAYIFVKKSRLRWLTLLIFLPMISWQMRTYSSIGKFSLHPIYSENNQSLYRPPHEAMTDLFRIWESDGKKFHGFIFELQRDTTTATLENALKMVHENFGPEIRGLAKEYQMLINEQALLLDQKGYLVSTENEKNLTLRIKAKTLEIRNKNLWDYSIKTPIESAKYLLSKSHLHQNVFQLYWRGSLWVEILRFVCLMVLAGSLVLSTLLLFGKTIPFSQKLLVTSVLLTMAYLIFIQRLNEERYMSPLLPVFFISGTYMFSQWMKSKKTEEEIN